LHELRLLVLGVAPHVGQLRERDHGDAARHRCASKLA
jgi:hypothetical protein